MAAKYWYIGSDTEVTIKGLKDHTGQIVNGDIPGGVSMTGRMCDQKEQPLAGTSDLTFTYVPNSAGNYVATVPRDTPLVFDRYYDLMVTVVIAGKQLKLRVRRQAKYVEA